MTICNIAVVIIGFEEEMYVGNENDGTVEVAVVLLRGTLSREVEVRLYTADGTARSKSLSSHIRPQMCRCTIIYQSTLKALMTTSLSTSHSPLTLTIPDELFPSLLKMTI